MSGFFFPMDFIAIGVVVKPHGLKGAVVVKVDAAYAAQFSAFKTLYLSQFSSMVPYAVKEIDVLNANMFKVTLAGLDSIDKAEALRGTEVYQLESDLVISMEVPYIGMEIFTAGNNKLGVVVDVIENKSQLLLAVETFDSKEVLIPLVEAFVVKIDLVKKRLVLDLPEGLLDI